jgi:hypothetical protein
MKTALREKEEEAFHLHLQPNFHLHLPLFERPASWNICRQYEVATHASMVDRRIQKLFSSYPQLAALSVEIL